MLNSFWAAVLLAGCLTFPVFGQSAIENDENRDGRSDLWISSNRRGMQVKTDRNFDGRVDYIVDYDSAGNRIREEQDYNHDGTMDDFYFYEAGKLTRREVDTNYDGEIDLWIFLNEGVYVEGYKRDTNFDGVIDVHKVYGAAEE